MKLLTRFDFDGVCCAVLLKEAGIVSEIEFIHPKELQDGNVKVSKNDVLANVPFVEGCGLWFDHHSSEKERLDLDGKFEGASRMELSAARVIYDYYGGAEKFPNFEEMLEYVDIADSARFTVDDILDPQRWILLAFICDPRTGLAYYDGYRVSHYKFMYELIEMMRNHSIDEILELEDVKERVQRYFDQEKVHKEFLLENSRQDGPVLINDTRGKDNVPVGNRFLVYSLFPESEISIRLIDGKNKENVVFAVGHSIINRGSNVNVGSLMLRYQGGGHFKVGTCQIPSEIADQVLEDMVTEIKAKSS